MMTIEELGQEYLDKIPALNDLILKKKAELKCAAKEGEIAKVKSLNHDICILSDMKSECQRTGIKLKNYYVKERKRRVRSPRKY